MRPDPPHHANLAPASEGYPAGTLSLDRLAFFDLETTGLSGGSGTIAFLATVASFEGRDLILRQTFMEDYPGESDFLEIVCAQLMAADWVASYNGASFDLPLLQSRCVVNRIPPPLVKQIDLLHDCRRFWSYCAESCTLGSMEAFLLAKIREEDIPGALVPRVWLEYVKADSLREEQKALMSLVWRHNLEDVISLAQVFLVVESAYRDPGDALIRYSINPSGFAKSLLRAGRFRETKEMLIRVRDVPEDFQLSMNLKTKALRQLASMARRESDRELYAKTILSMDDNSLYGCIAKAKLYEHLEKDERAALAWALRAKNIIELRDRDIEDHISATHTDLSASIEHRLARLRKKLERKTEKDVQGIN